MQPPKILHRIWFGSFLPSHYQENLRQLFRHNGSSYKLVLWTDFESLSTCEIRHFKGFCNVNNIHLINIREHDALENFDLIAEELDKAINQANEMGFQPKLHYVRASDLARIGILIAHGGIYTDTDTESIAPLPTLTSPLGILCKKNPELSKTELKELNKQYPDYTGIILYDFIAATPNNPILLITAQVSRTDYHTYHQVKQDAWEYIERANFHLEMTVSLTGTALRCAINHFTRVECIANSKSKHLFFDDSPFLMSNYEKSWLSIDDREFYKGHNNNPTFFRQYIYTTAKDEKIIRNFRMELLLARGAHFFEPNSIEQPKAQRSTSSPTSITFFSDLSSGSIRLDAPPPSTMSYVK